MKKLVVLLMFFSAFSLFANENKTLFGSNVTHGGFGGPEMKFTNLGNDFGILMGGKGAWIINKKFYIGGGGYGLTTDYNIDNYEHSDYNPNYDGEVNLRTGYGGMIFGYINNQENLLHFSAELLIGGGGATYSNDNIWSNHNNNNYDFEIYENDIYFVLEPSLYLEMNVTNFMVMGVGGSYRFVNGLEMTRTNDADLSGFSGNIVFKFGKF